MHRDVGPANVLVSTTGDVKLADFGIAKATALADLTAAGTRKGKYAYMAPEQLARRAARPRRAISSGSRVTLVELVTGARPFAGDTPWATMQRIRSQAGAPLVTLDGELGDIARTSLAVEPRDRHASIDLMRARLARLTAAGPVELATWVLTPT